MAVSASALKGALVMTIVVLSMASHGGAVGSVCSSSTGTKEETQTAPQGDETPDGDLEREFLPSGYARVVRVDPSDLGMSDEDVDVSRIRILEGQDLIEDLVAQGGEIRFITPADPGQTRTIRMRADVPRVRKELKIELASFRSPGVADITEFEEGADDNEPLPLLVKGLGADNSIGGEDLVFEVERDIEIDKELSNALLEVDGRGTVSLRGVWVPLDSGRGFLLKREALTELIQRLPDGDVDISISFNGYGRSMDFSRHWAFVAHVPVARMEGWIIDTKTKEPVRGLAGRKVGITGMGTNGTRTVAVVDGEGRFSTDGLSAGNYMVELLDSRVTGFTKAAFTVKRDDKSVQVELPYVASVYELVKSRKTKAGPWGVSGKNLSGGNGSKVFLVSEIEGRNCADITKNSYTDFGFKVMASPADKVTGLNSCVATLRIPQGMVSVGLTARVLGNRRPDRVDNNSKDRDDMWSYSVFNLPGEVSGFGKSTDGFGYVKNGLTFSERCIDVSTLTKDGPHDFSINLVASNTGRRDTYEVDFWVKSGCRAD